MERFGRPVSSVVTMAEVNALMSDSEATAAEPAGASTESWFRERLELSLERGYRLASVIIGESEAEDVTHDSLERAWRSRTSLRDPDRFDAWFSRILVNACRDRMRKRRSAPRPISIESAAAHGSHALEVQATDPFGGDARRDALRRALDHLVPDQRIVIALRFYLDLEIDEIARRVGIRPGTVKSRLHRGLRELRAAWDAGERPAAERNR